MATRRLRKDMVAVLRKAYAESKYKTPSELATKTQTPMDAAYAVFRDGQNSASLKTTQKWCDELGLRLVAAKQFAELDEKIQAMRAKLIESGKSKRGKLA